MSGRGSSGRWTSTVSTRASCRPLASWVRFDAWSSLVEGGEGSHLPNCQTNLVIALDALSLLFCIFINTTAYHLGIYDPSSSVSCGAPRFIALLCSICLTENIFKHFLLLLIKPMMKVTFETHTQPSLTTRDY